MADLPALNSVSTPVSSTTNLRPTAQIGDLRTVDQARFNTMTVGREFQAIVLAMTREGKSLVQFPPSAQNPEVSHIQMQLPPGVNVGDKIDLKLLSPPPEMSFQFGNQAISVPNESVDLSETAKLLGTLLQSNDPNQGDASTIKGSQALLQTTPKDSKQMANELPTHLQQAVQLSGAFYESHLKEWANGQRTIEQVRQEPQNHMPPTKNSESGHISDLPQTQLIPAQLNAQENRQFLWRGELLPGQKFEWQVKEDQSKKSSPESTPTEKSWITSVKFNLPKLGQVSATISLVGNTAGFRIATQNPESVSILNSAQPILNNSLEASGTTLSQFLVEKDANS
jgi:hypothetical protein